MKNKKDFLDELSSQLSPDRVKKAKKEAEKEIFKIRLSELRKKVGMTQKEINAFSQSGISKLEARKDMKISTLIEYLESIGMGIEIKAISKKRRKKHDKDEYTLIKA